MHKCRACSRTFQLPVNLHRHFKRSHARKPVGPARSPNLSTEYISSILQGSGNNGDSELPDVCVGEDVTPGPGIDQHIISQDEDECITSQPPVSQDVYAFFEAFKDSSLTLFPRIKEPEANSHPACSILVQNCIKNEMQLNQSAREAHMLLEMEQHNPRSVRPVRDQFQTADKFCKYVDQFRKYRVHKEGWRKASISTAYGTNDTGVYRFSLKLMLEELGNSDGASAIQECRAQFNSSDRIYSSPWDSELLHQYHDAAPHMKIVSVDVYCDRTILSKSGTQSASTLRVRFSNLRGISREWYEVGIALLIVSDGREASKAELRKERLQLFQRYLFVALKDLIEASVSGIISEDSLIFPRIAIVVADRPQERAFYCLKGADSYADCILCTMPFKWLNPEERSCSEGEIKSAHFGDVYPSKRDSV